MKRNSILGLCLVSVLAVFGLSALGAASASAGTYYWCRTAVPKKTGNYTESKCVTVAGKTKKGVFTPDHKGTFETVPVTACVEQKDGNFTESKCETVAGKVKKGVFTPDHKGKFELSAGRKYTSKGGAAALSTPAFGPGEVKCKANTDSGEITGPATDVDQVTFTGCEFEGLPCESAGPNSVPSHTAGVIITAELQSKLIDNPETLTIINQKDEPETVGPAAGHVWNDLFAVEKEGYSSEFNCGGVVFLRTKGQDAGEYTAGSLNHLSSTSETKFEAGVGAQGLLTEVLTEAGWVGPAPSIEEAGVATTTSESEIEVRS
jgi:hypothetical protein